MKGRVRNKSDCNRPRFVLYRLYNRCWMARDKSVTERRRFFVYIIESPSEADFYHGRSEGAIVQQALSLELLPSSMRIAISRDAFNAALTFGIVEEMKKYEQLLPMIHISAHGSDSGLQLSNHDVITWDELRELLVPINNALENALLLCMSSCEGFSACKMAMRYEERHPFFGMVSHSGKPTWADTAIAYATFYHLVAKGTAITDAVKAMKIAAGDYGFTSITADQARNFFIDNANKVNLIQAQEIMQRRVQSEAVTTVAKQLERG